MVSFFYFFIRSNVDSLVPLQAELGLSELHRDLVLDFLKFSRFKRAQYLKDLESAFSDLADSRLTEETFTSKFGCCYATVGNHTPTPTLNSCLGDYSSCTLHCRDAQFAQNVLAKTILTPTSW
jgi:hypothetical protein